MWVILQNNAAWDCFKTPILREILRIQNLLDVKETDINFSQFNSSWDCFLMRGLRMDGVPPLEGLILSQALKVSMREVPSCYGFRVNNTTGLQIGSIIFGKSQTYKPKNKPIRIHCKTGYLSAVFETRAKCQEFCGSIQG